MLNIPVLIGVIVWMAVMFAIGIIAGLRVRTSSSFFIGGRDVGMLPAADAILPGQGNDRTFSPAGR